MKIDSKETLKIALNATSQLVVRFSGTLTSFLATFLIAKFLGVEELGSFIKITTFVALFYLFIDYGINSYFLKHHFEKAEELFGNLLALRFFISIFVFILVGVLTLALPDNGNSGYSGIEKIGILIFSCTLFTEGVLVSFSGLLQKHLLQRKLILPSILSSVILLAGICLSIYLHSLSMLLLSYPVSELFQIILLHLFLKRNISYSFSFLSFSSFSRKALLSSSPLALMLVLNVVYFRADSFILALFRNNMDVGIYGFSYKIFEFLIAFPTFFSAGVFPILIKNVNNEKVFEDKVLSHAGILLGASLIFLTISCILAPFIALIKPEFLQAVFPLQILSCSLPFFFLTSLFQWVLLLKEKIKQLVFIYASTMFLNILLNIIFIPKYSYIAASFITLVTEGLVCLFMIFIIIRLRFNKNG